MDTAEHAGIEFSLAWSSPFAKHTDRYHHDRIDFWPDLYPHDPGERLAGLERGETAEESFSAGELLEPYTEGNVHRLVYTQLNRRLAAGRVIEPYPGRFYPRAMVAGWRRECSRRTGVRSGILARSKTGSVSI